MDDYKRNMQQSAAALGHVAMSLQHFSVMLMRIGLDAGVLNAETLGRLREETIRSLKNAQTVRGEHGDGRQCHRAGARHA